MSPYKEENWPHPRAIDVPLRTWQIGCHGTTPLRYVGMSMSGIFWSALKTFDQQKAQASPARL